MKRIHSAFNLKPGLCLSLRHYIVEHPKLALIAGLVGQVQGGSDTGRWGKARGRHVRQIPYADSKVSRCKLTLA